MKYVRRSLAIALLALIGLIAWRTARASDMPPMSAVDEALLQRVVATRQDVAFEGTPLGEVTALLSQRYGVPVSHEFESLGAESVDARIPVRASATHARVTDVLRQIRPVALRDGRFVLTTPNIAKDEPQFTQVIDGRKHDVRGALKRVRSSYYDEIWHKAADGYFVQDFTGRDARVRDLYFIRGTAFSHFLLRAELEDMKSTHAR